MRVRVPDNCLGLDAAGGRRYDARHGIVDVDPIDVPAISRSYAGQIGLIVQSVSFASAPGRTCACGFSAFAWQEKCPRCGRKLKEEA